MSNALYTERLMSAADAVALIPSGARVAMGLGFSQPPAILAALAERAAAGQVDDVSLYYLLSTGIAGGTVFRDELMGRIRPMSLFHSAIERGLEARARAAGRPNPVTFIPTGFQQVPRLMREAGVDTLICTVSPMDDDGFFSFGIWKCFNHHCHKLNGIPEIVECPRIIYDEIRGRSFFLHGHLFVNSRLNLLF